MKELLANTWESRPKVQEEDSPPVLFKARALRLTVDIDDVGRHASAW